MIYNLFPQPIGVYKLNRDLTEEEIGFIKNQETQPNMGNLVSVNSTILRHNVMSELLGFIESSMSDYFATIHNPKHAVNLRITQSWCNYTEPGGYHHKHAHPNSFVSGVFYPQANQEIDKIYFYKNGYRQIKILPENVNVWNSEFWWFAVGTGTLILFPSSLEHNVEPVEGNQTRISLSFNTFPVGNIGEEVNLTGLSLNSSGI